MSENSKINYRELFKKTAVTYDETVERIKSEQQRPQVDRFRMGEDGDYLVRVLPLAPILDQEGNPLDEQRKSFEYPLRQIFLDIQGAPKKKGGKPSVINIPVIQATQEGVGKSIDLIDTYKTVARDLYADDPDVLELLKKGTFEHGLKWSSQRVMYVFDLNAKKGQENKVLLWQASYAQYAEITSRQTKLWNKRLAKDSDAEDPLAGFGESCALDIERKTENKKTEYFFTIDTEEKVEVTDEQLEVLFNAPRIPDIIYRYTRYHMEATIEFLKQYDERHDLDVMSDERMAEAIDKLKGELDPSDNSHFDLATAGSGDDKGGRAALTIDYLNDQYDALLDKGLADDSEEGVELREDIRAFIEENGLNVTLKHSMSTEAMLDAVEAALKDKPAIESKEEKKEKSKKNDDDEDEKPAERKSRRAKKDEPGDEPEDEPEKKEKDDDDEPEPEPRRRRSAKPSRDDDDDDDKEPAEKSEKKDDDEEEAPTERRRRRREMR